MEGNQGNSLRGGHNQLICGDALEIIKQMPDKSVDIIFDDPPYGINVGNHGYVQKKKYLNQDVSWDTMPINAELLKEYFRVSKHQIIFGGNYIANLLPPTSGWVVWDKKKEGFDNRFSDCELIWTSYQTRTRIIRYFWAGWYKQKTINFDDTEYFHPTQKPLAVAIQILRMFGKRGMTVLDPHTGSGTFCIAAQNLGMDYVGIDKNSDYVERARKRMVKEELYHGI